MKERDPRLRRLALGALVSASGSGRGWSRDRRARLEQYRTDGAPAVAGAAVHVFPPARKNDDPEPGDD